jgi:hypothetical protein
MRRIIMNQPTIVDGVVCTDSASVLQAARPAGHGQLEVASQAGRRIVSVYPVGSSIANGLVLLAALNDIVATVDTPYRLTIAAGVYDLGPVALQMKAYVDIEGAGERTTVITSHVSARNSGTVIGADQAALCGLTIANSGGGTLAVAIYNDAVAPRLDHVTAIAAGAQGNYGIYNCNAAAPLMTYLNASAVGGSCNAGVYNDGASPIMTHMAASGSGGRVSYGVYNFDGAAPLMTDVIATAAGGDRSVGLYNEESFPTLVDVVAYASGGIHNIDSYNA